MQRFKMEKIDQIICPVKINQKDWIGIESGELLEENLNKIFLLRGLVGIVRKEKRKNKRIKLEQPGTSVFRNGGKK